MKKSEEYEVLTAEEIAELQASGSDFDIEIIGESNEKDHEKMKKSSRKSLLEFTEKLELIELTDQQIQEIKICEEPLEDETCAFVNEKIMITIPKDVVCPTKRAFMSVVWRFIFGVLLLFLGFIVPIIMVLIFYNSQGIDNIYIISQIVVFGLSAVCFLLGIKGILDYKSKCWEDIKDKTLKTYWNEGFVSDWIIGHDEDNSN